MAHFVIEIHISAAMHALGDFNILRIAHLIASANGRLRDFDIHPASNILNLIVEAKSEYIIIDLLEGNAFDIGQIRRIFLLDHYAELDEDHALPPDVCTASRIGDDNRSAIMAIEIYPH